MNPPSGYSWLLDCALDIRPERKGVLEWLRAFPMQSFSLVRGLSRDDRDTFQGAICFDEEKADILTRLKELPLPTQDAQTEAGAELTRLFYQLSGVPPFLAGDRGVRIFADFVQERQNLYSVSIISNLFGQWTSIQDVFVSVTDAGGENLLIVGSSPEEVERASNALNDESTRLEIVRRNPGRASFLQIVDDASGNETREMVDDMYWGFEPKAPTGLELSLGLSERGVEVSLWHTFFDTLFGESFRLKGGWNARDAGFALGGGYPWLAGSLSPALTEENILELLAFFTRGDSDRAREALTQIGVELSTLAGAFRSIGLVLGGNASMYDEWVPGGYAFISGDAEKMRLLAPVIKLFLNNRLSRSFQAVDRDGWDIFYAFADEYRERAAGTPLHAGLKDGVLMMGVLDEDELESAPEIDWPEDGGDGPVLLKGRLDFSRFVAQCRDFVETVSLPRAYEAALAMDMEDLFTPGLWAGAFKFFAAAQEIGQATLVMPDSNRLELTIETTFVDYENVWELMRMSRMLSKED